MNPVTVKIALNGIKKILAGISPGAQPISAMLKQWAARYRSFAQERFDKYSRGNGDWAPLALSTIKGRRKGKKSKKTTTARDTKNGTLVVVPGSYSILRDTGLLFNALAPEFKNAPGQFEKEGDLSIDVGFGGPAAHGNGILTVADIAAIHQVGGKNLPARPIIVKPSDAVVSAMTGDARRAIKKLSNG